MMDITLSQFVATRLARISPHVVVFVAPVADPQHGLLAACKMCKVTESLPLDALVTDLDDFARQHAHRADLDNPLQANAQGLSTK